MYLTFSLTDINEAASWFWNTVNDRKVFAFSGQMGAGKTTFITALCHYKNVRSHISSPTFSIINEYQNGEGQIFHIDLYRLNSEHEAVEAGVEDVLNSGEICFVEWPEKAASILPSDTVWVKLEVIDPMHRKITVSV
jgi:tRNA threonylcarbamoyladenosine biosynthesis protein TsaE